MQKIILYYKFTPISDPHAIMLWQRALCARLGLKGRILISKHGINGTVGGEIEAVKSYVRETKEYEAFKGTDFKWSDGNGRDFPRLSVKVRDEIVSFKAGDELQVDERGVVNGGTHLTPEQVHELVDQKGDDVVFFDGRNKHEAAVGRFKGAVIPDVETSHDFISELDSGRYDHLKQKAVVTYCTGGVRCEILSSLMKSRGFEEVYQIDGGIVRYGERYKDDGLWEGSLYVFDGRQELKFSDRAKVIGSCSQCGLPTSNYENCAEASCNKLVLACGACVLKEKAFYHLESCRPAIPA